MAIPRAKSPALSVQVDKSMAMAEIDEKLRARLVSELTTSELERWYCGMVPVTEDRECQRRAQSTADRTPCLFFAALNHAYRNRRDAVPSADAWRAVRRFRNNPGSVQLKIDPLIDSPRQEPRFQAVMRE